MKKKRITLLHIIARNLLQNGFRTGAMFLLVFMLSATLYVTTFVAEGLKNGLQSTIKQVNADILVVPDEYIGGIKSALFQGEPVTVTFLENITEIVSQMENIKSVSTQLFLATLDEGCCDAGSAQLIAYDKNAEVVKPWLDKGVSPYIDLYEVVVGSDMNFEVSDTANFFGVEFKVVGKLTKTGMGYDKSAFITQETAYELSKTPIAKNYFNFSEDKCEISTLLIQVKPRYSVEIVAKKIRKKLQGKSTIVYTTQEFVEETKEQIRMFEKVSNILLFLLFIVAVFSYIFVFGITMNERQKEFGILISLGGTKFQTTGIIVAESLSIVLIGSVSGIFFGEGLIYIGEQWLKITCGLPILYPDFFRQEILAIITILATSGSGLIAAVFSAFRMNVAQPYLLIKENE